jgi:hypothetical protein
VKMPRAEARGGFTKNTKEGRRNLLER